MLRADAYDPVEELVGSTRDRPVVQFCGGCWRHIESVQELELDTGAVNTYPAYCPHCHEDLRLIESARHTPTVGEIQDRIQRLIDEGQIDRDTPVVFDPMDGPAVAIWEFAVVPAYQTNKREWRTLDSREGSTTVLVLW